MYESFDKADTTGIVPMPDTTKEALLGGHCVLMVGFNNVTQRFICVNSWGASWGDRGFFTIPYEYVVNPLLAADFCVLNFVY